MLRGQTAPLSPHEEITLRRVALHACPAADLSLRDLDRLQTLGLIKMSADDAVLTPLGLQRYESLPRATPIAEGEHDRFIASLKACLAQARK